MQYEDNRVSVEEEKIFGIDAGSGWQYTAPERLGIGPNDVDAWWLSHLHDDHVGSFEAVMLQTFFNPANQESGWKPKLYFANALSPLIWDACLRAGAETTEFKQATLSDYFTTYPVKPNDSFLWEGYHMAPFQTIHVINGSAHMPSYGLTVTTPEGKTVFVPTDSQFLTGQMIKFYRNADIIFQDCETTPWESGVHAHYKHLCILPDDVKAKMWLYHYSDRFELPDCVADGFAGWVRPLQELDMITLEPIKAYN